MPFALVFTVALALLAAFQLALVAGAPWGRVAWGGQDRVLPAGKRIGSVISILIYGLMAAVAWDRVGAISILPDLFSRIAMWVIFAYLAFGIFLNAISRSKPERYTMVPVATALAVLSLLIALGVGERAMAI